MPFAARCVRLALLILIFFAFAGIGLIFPSEVYACEETNLKKVPDAVTSCAQSDFCGSVSNTCNKACGSTGSINPIYDRRVLFTYTDNTACESTVIFKSLTACNDIILTQQATEVSCVNTCNPSLAGVREGITTNNTGPCTGGSFCTGGLTDHCPANATTTGPGSWCEAWTCNWGTNCGTSSYTCGPNPTGPYTSQSACNTSCPPTPTLTPTPISPPTVDLRVNSVKSVTVNSGDGIVLSWTTTNTDPNRRCTGRDAFFGVSPYPGDSPYPTIIQTNTGDSNLTKTYTLFCYNSNGVASQASSVSVTIKPPQPDRPVCIPSCPNSADVTCGNPLGRDSCEGSCPGTGTKCNNPDQNCENNSCVTPTSFACQIWAQQPNNPCTSSPCPVNLGANYFGPRQELIQQCWSFGGAAAECNLSSDQTTRNFTCGQSTSVRLVAKDNSGNEPNQAECTTYISPTCSNTPASFITPGGLVCLRGAGNCSTTENGIWSDKWTSTSAGIQCNYPRGTTATSPDPAQVGGTCWTPRTAEPDPPVGGKIAGRLWLEERGNRTMIRDLEEARNLLPLHLWIYHGGLYDPGRCLLTNSPLCTFNDIYCINSVGCNGWGFSTLNLVYVFSANNVGFIAAKDPGNAETLQLLNWPLDYEPVGYYTYQKETFDTRQVCRCGSTNNGCTDGRKALYPEVETACAQCSNQTDTLICDPENYNYRCIRTAEYTSLSSSGLTRGQANNIHTIPCQPDADPFSVGAIVDLVFKKAIYKISGTIFYDDNQDGIKDESERRIYDSGGTVVLNLSGTASSPSINLSSDNKPTGYSFDNLRGGNYLLRFTLPPGARLRITSPNPVSYPLFQPLNSDQVVNFGITDNPDAWIQTVGGDVHSNTLINTPGGP